MSADCWGFAELKSAYVDGALTNRDRERLLRHLIECPSCRREVVELQSVHRLLNDAGQPVRPSVDLSQRLVAIAGSHSSAPLRVRSFRRTRRVDPYTGLPRRRQVFRARLGAATLTVGVAVTVVTAVGYAAAPTAVVTSIDDPTSEAQAAFSSTLGQFPLTSDSLGAVMSADAASLTPDIPATTGGPSMVRGEAVSAEAARQAMVRAATADRRVSYSGLQSFTIVRDGDAMVADVEVEARVDEGRQFRVIGGNGSSAAGHFSPADYPGQSVDVQLLGLLERNYALTAARGAVVAGRPATVVAAMRNGLAAARWWVDDATGILLWQQTYDDIGKVDLSYGFVSVAVGRRAGFGEHYPARFIVPSTTTPLTLPAAAQLQAAGWSCGRDLAGLSLVRLRSDAASDPSALHLVYSDGVSTVTVFEQRGRLPSAPRGLTWDPVVGAHVRHAATEVAAWQSGDRVLTVVTDGSEELLTAAVRSLPHVASPAPTTMGRVKAGWAKIAADVKG